VVGVLPVDKENVIRPRARSQSPLARGFTCFHVGVMSVLAPKKQTLVTSTKGLPQRLGHVLES
jgi:hypothetical protein